MDDLVKQALAKWPNVPDCFGWLALDRRGQWRIGTERQAITNAAITAFINRNYLQDERGRCLFQNGPQRVFVELDYTPYVWRLLPAADKNWVLTDHTGVASGPVSTIWLDSDGHFLLQSNERIGVLHDHDSAQLADWLCDGQGRLLDEAEAGTAIGALLHSSDAVPALWLRWLGESDRLLPIHGIRPDEVAKKFGFDAHPAKTQDLAN